MQRTALLLTAIFYLQMASAQDKIYWADQSYQVIRRAGPDGTNPETVLAGARPTDLFLDAANSKIYWADAGPGAIMRSNTDGSGKEVVVSGFTDLKGFAIDAAAGYFYIVDAGQGKIIRTTTTGAGATTLVSGLSDPDDIVIDPASGVMYWSDHLGGKIYKANLDGTNKSQLVSGINYPSELCLDLTAGYIYWMYYGGGVPGSGVSKAKTDGTGVTSVISDFVYGFTIDPAHNYLYYSHQISKTVYRTNLNGAGKIDLLANADLNNPTSIQVDPADGKVYLIDLNYANYMTRCDNNGSNQQTLATMDVYRPAGFAVDTTHKEIYWVSEKSSYSSDHAGGIFKKSLTGGSAQLLVPNNNEVFSDFVVDFQHGKMYWTDLSWNLILASNLDGTGLDTIVGTNLSYPYGLALDLGNGKLYWGNYGGGKIEKANLDGSGREVVIPSGITPKGIALDLINHKIYWTNNSPTAIRRANLDGTNIQDLVTSGLYFPQGISVDPIGGKFYWGDYGNGRVSRANLDGTTPEIIVPAGPNYPAPAHVWYLRTSATATHEPQQVQLELSPNPVSDVLTVRCPVAEGQLMLYDAKGTLVMSKTIQAGVSMIPVNSLEAGAYFAVFYQQGAPVFNTRIVRQ